MASTVRRIRLGSQGLEVSAQGLGCMGMFPFYGPPKPDSDMIALIHHAVGSGVTFLDTNEILIGKGSSLVEVLKGGVTQKAKLATKFRISYADGKAESHCVDLYYQHRIDTRVHIEVTIGELKKLVEEGKIKYIGSSEASASTTRRAHAVHPVTAAQLERSLWSRDEALAEVDRLTQENKRLRAAKKHVENTSAAKRDVEKTSAAKKHVKSTSRR